MALTKKDLQEIGKVVDERIEAKVPGMIDGLRTEMNQGFGLSRLEVNQRFDATDKKIDGVEERLTTKIEEIKQMETEDVQVLYTDVARLKKKIALT